MKGIFFIIIVVTISQFIESTFLKTGFREHPYLLIIVGAVIAFAMSKKKR